MSDSEQYKLFSSLYSSHLAENNGHEEKVEQQCLRQMTVVEGEEENGEQDAHILVGGTAVRGTKQLQAGHCDHQSSDSGGHFKQEKLHSRPISRPDECA